MLALRYLLFAFVLLFYILSVKGDSIVKAPSEVVYHYQKNGAYLYPSAAFGSVAANRHLFELTQQIEYLKQAANLGDPHAAFTVYQQELKSVDYDPEQDSHWLNLAISLGSNEARLVKLEQQVAAQNWSEAQTWYKRYLSQWPRLERNSLKRLNRLQRQIDTAINSEYELANQTSSTNSNLDPTFENSDGRIATSLAVEPNHCTIVADVLVVAERYRHQVNRLMEEFSESGLGASLVCFNPPQYLPEIASLCAKDHAQRIECDQRKLAVVYQNNLKQRQAVAASHLLIISQSGEANTRGGLMFLDQEDTTDVLIHEVGHWLNLFDEYEIHPSQQAILCKTQNHKALGKNLVVAKAKIDKDELQAYYNRPLYETNTCRNTRYQAYKFQPTASFMEFLDLPVTPFYRNLLSRAPVETVTPFAMNFALAFGKLQQESEGENEAEQDFINKQHLFWLNLAADQGFAPAKRILAQHHIKNQAYLTADRLLNEAAEQGDPTSQVLLGHFYIDSVWLKQDLQQAAYWYKKAAQQNDPYGLYFYGKCLENGWGCIKDIELAFEYYEKAQFVGSSLAQARLAKRKN